MSTLQIRCTLQNESALMGRILTYLIGASILLALAAAASPPVAKLFNSKTIQRAFVAVWAAMFFELGRSILHETSVGVAIALIVFWATLQFAIPWLSRR